MKVLCRNPDQITFLSSTKWPLFPKFLTKQIDYFKPDKFPSPMGKIRGTFLAWPRLSWPITAAKRTALSTIITLESLESQPIRLSEKSCTIGLASTAFFILVSEKYKKVSFSTWPREVFLYYHWVNCLKITQNVAFEFWISAFSTNFCPIKTDMSGNTVWLQASGVQKLAKMDHFWHF